jgi:hypothetical protein
MNDRFELFNLESVLFDANFLGVELPSEIFHYIIDWAYFDLIN